MLPDMSGLDVCRKLKANAATEEIPILIASARGEEVDRVVGLSSAPMTTSSSRSACGSWCSGCARSCADSASRRADAVEFGCLKIDRAAHRVFVQEQEVQLTALEFRLLTTLHERKNRTQARDTLLLDVWQLNTPIESRTVDTHVKRLREKLGAAAPYIRTVRGVGYRFASSPDEPMGGD